MIMATTMNLGFLQVKVILIPKAAWLLLRLVFETRCGKAVPASQVDIGERTIGASKDGIYLERVTITCPFSTSFFIPPKRQQVLNEHQQVFAKASTTLTNAASPHYFP